MQVCELMNLVNALLGQRFLELIENLQQMARTQFGKKGSIAV